MGKQMKVLMVVFNLSVANGVSSFVMNYFRKLDHNTIIMDFVVYQDVETPYKKEILQAGGKIHVIPSIKNIRQHIKESKKVIIDGQYDIVHDNILILSYFVMHYAKKYNVPVRILHSHNAKLGETQFKEIRNGLFMPFLLREANTYFACSQLAAKCMFGNKPYTFIPNIVSSKNLKFNPHVRERMRKEGAVNNKKVILTVGRLDLQKNPFYAIDVICCIHEFRDDILYWWIGDGKLEKEVQSYIEQKHAEKFICLLGRKENVADYYQAADLFFLPSKFEGLPVTGVEAQAMGLLCFVSDAITRQFIYTDLVKTFSIKNSPENTARIFAEWLNSIPLDRDRTKYIKFLEGSQFCDWKAGQFLETVYKKIFKLRQYHN